MPRLWEIESNMCFSAEASFSVGVALLPAGAYCIYKSINKNHAYLGFSATPLLFGMQQLSEGFGWLGLRDDDAPSIKSASLFFLFFAFAVWPFWISFSTWLIETRPIAKRVLAALWMIGLTFGLFLFVPILINSAEWLTTSSSNHSLRYDIQALPAFRILPDWLWQCVYATVVISPLIIVKTRELRIFGILIGVSAIVSHVAYSYAFVSIWCAFSAIQSAYLVWFFAKITLPNPNQSDLIHAA